MNRKFWLAGIVLAGGVGAWATSMGGIVQRGAPPAAPGMVKLVNGASAPLAGRSFAMQGALASPATTYDFSAVKAAIDNSSINNVAIVVGNAQGELFAYGKGSFTPDTQTDIASASKWLTGTLTYRLVEAGKLSLSDHAYQYFSYWTQDPGDVRSQITLEQLLSMQSGFNAKPWLGGCVLYPYTTLQNCAKTIYLLGTNSDPGTGFSYGPHHIQVAAAMAEAAGGASFNNLFAQYVTTPLGMSQTAFVKASDSNPWAAGGAQSTARDYAKLLRALLAGGFIQNIDAFTQSRTTNTPILYEPGSVTSAGDWKYALGSWVECDGSDFVADHCADQKVNSSPGAYGFTPWIDRQHGYYAVISMNIPLGDDDGVGLEQTVQPLIEAALAQ